MIADTSGETQDADTGREPPTADTSGERMTASTTANRMTAGRTAYPMTASTSGEPKTAGTAAYPMTASTSGEPMTAGAVGMGRVRPTAGTDRVPLAEPDRLALLDLLTSARQQGFLGPGDIDAHLAHSQAFAAVVADPPGRAIDLGSGAGIPGLVLAALWPESHWALLDANVRRTGFLRHAVASLHLTDRVEVLASRAELVGRDPVWRSTADLVVTRGFGPPAVAAECGAPLLRTGGTMVVAEPPGGAPDRWPAAGLDVLGLAVDGHVIAPVALQRLRQVVPCPDRYPRRVGIPLKRPLF